MGNYLAKRKHIEPQSEAFGRAFEHFIAMEVRAYLQYARLHSPLGYWRSTSQFEVDFVVGEELAVEVKAARQVQEKHLKGLRALREERIVKNFCVVSLDEKTRTVDGVTIYPWRVFLERLWGGDLIGKS